MYGMSRISIKSSKSTYEINLIEGQLESLGLFDALIVDERVPLPRALMAIPAIKLKATEGKKTLSTVEDICTFLLAQNCGRSSKVLAVGGGFVQDVATLAASIYMRGIDWSYAPTTLIGMADSCIGGKSSINIAAGKNVIGNFYPPSQIFIATKFLETLDPDSLKAGLFESVKILYAKGQADFMQIIDLPVTQGIGSSSDWALLILQTLLAKKWFVEIDEFDKKERQLLNFGHTFGHALEAGCGYRIPHGLAVGYGMLAAIRYQDIRGDQTIDRLARYCLEIMSQTTQALSFDESSVDWDQFVSGILSDKKNTPSEISLILPITGGGLEIRRVPKDPENLERILLAMKSAVREVTRNEVF